ncbi:hypothetical protein ACP8HI_04355 [Paenibacillus sp. FA6]|uniref:hypothetical protein n=1 Tax=Paenibacillus sp. FA6 TaxID=3413029 RepID=UPI003F65C66E
MKKLLSKLWSIRKVFIHNKRLLAHKAYLEIQLGIANVRAEQANTRLKDFKSDRIEYFEHLRSVASYQANFIELNGLQVEYTEYVRTLLADSKKEVVS